MKALIEKLAEIQRTLNAPKNQRNSFGGYNYRSCEDILMAAKPLLAPAGLVVTISDEITQVSDRIYVKATATISDGENSISTTAFAREASEKKGMDASQVTGSTSSYARKYALNGLFLIDDNKDADHMDNREEPSKTKPATISAEQVESITALADEVNADVPKMLGFYKVKSLSELPLLAYHDVITKLEKKRA